jgi:hypothetical protein
VVSTEQGYGDVFQFARYGRLLRARGIHALLRCPGNLRTVLSGCNGFAGVVSADDFVPTGETVWLPIMSLPLMFATRLTTIPAGGPYLHADPARTEFWRERLGPRRAFRIGICWCGNRRNDSVLGLHAARSIALEHLRPLAQLSGAQLVSLQRSSEAGELSHADFGHRVVEFGAALDGREHAFVEIAALMMNLDLIVSCDTAVAHLAGALGVPVFVALPAIAEWRWLTGRSDSPWYPTMRLFRQTRPGDWRDAFERMSRELQGLIAADGR